mmetsp:Transcript_41419/g.119898  ORF Transcript_41419/g.119898 Transcript_41419/m.119898 type:complete len:210 (+) Transcript_41419:1513-2142(+)
MARATEVCQLQLGVARRGFEQKVLGLDVAVDDGARMKVADGGEHLLNPQGRKPLPNAMRSLCDAVVELAARTSFQDQVDAGGVTVDLIEPDDVRVPHGRRYHNLGVEASVFCYARAQNLLYRDLLTRLQASRDPHDPVRAVAQPGTKSVILVNRSEPPHWQRQHYRRTSRRRVCMRPLPRDLHRADSRTRLPRSVRRGSPEDPSKTEAT